MQIICISRGTFSGGKELAELLAQKLDYVCVSRDELVDAATREGIQVGKLEMAMIKPRIFSERLALEKEHYLAFTTAYLCDRAMEGRLVYHGRTGHLLLPGVSHVLRLRVVSSEDQRIANAVKALGIDRKKAAKYIEEVDEDWRRWVHSMYEVSWEDAAHYDMTVNLEQMSVANAATALTSVAQLPDFQMTPASKKTMLDLRLGAKARMALAKDERTFEGSFKVRADSGVVTVSYLPTDSRYADLLSDVLESVEGIGEIRATMATSNILWVQENFDHTSDTFREVAEIATKWNAAVELVRLEAGNGDEDLAMEKTETPTEAVQTDNGVSREYNGGIEEDVEEVVCADGGLADTLRELAKAGRSGGGHIVCGGGDALLKSIDRTTPYTLVVIGDLFLEKGHAARLRMTRELQSFVSDHIKAPVVTAEELKSRYLFSKRDVINMAGYLALVAVIYFLVFTNQELVLNFLSGNWWDGKMLAKVIVSGAVFLIVPVIAYLYGSASKSLMKLIKME